MSRTFNHTHRLLAVIGILVAVVAATFVSVKPADAGGMGGVNVSVAKVCLNGVRFTGQVVNAAALNRAMTAKIFAGHVGTPINLKATGNTHTYTVVNQTRSFAIYYPATTFVVGAPVTISVLTSDGSGYGGGVFAYVQNCRIRMFR